MRWLIALLAVGLLGALAGGCGGAGSSSASNAAATNDAARTSSTTHVFVWPKPKHLPSIATTRRYLKDPDLPVSVIREDSRIFAFYGRAPSATVSHAVTATVKRYYALATADDGKQACSMITPSFVKALPIDYGQLGASYLHGAKTCQAVLSRMFKHSHAELTAPITVTGVLAKGDHAYAVLDSAKLPASVLPLVREGNAWMIYAPLAGKVPVAK